MNEELRYVYKRIARDWMSYNSHRDRLAERAQQLKDRGLRPYDQGSKHRAPALWALRNGLTPFFLKVTPVYRACDWKD